MSEFMAVLILTVVIGSVGFWAYHWGHNEAMRDAFERGYAIQCESKTGYFWECPCK